MSQISMEVRQMKKNHIVLVYYTLIILKNELYIYKFDIHKTT